MELSKLPGSLKRSAFCLVLLLILFTTRGNAQQMGMQQFITPINPLTPNAASLGVYGDVPVSMYTGIPNIQIPIYDIKVGGVSIPISLSYHAGGVKVEDYSSWVGTNWSLNAGGLINRQQRGDPDESMIDNYPQRKADFDLMLNPATSGPVMQGIATKYYAPNSNIDMESDIFYYNAGSLSGKFFMDPYGKVYCVPSNKLKIQQDGRITINSVYQTAFKRWKITDNNGVKYFFGSDSTESASVQEITNTTETDNDVVNSWYLTEVVTPGGEVITFNYTPYTYSLPVNTSYSKSYPNGAPSQASVGNTVVNYKVALRLTNITFPNGKVVFVAGGNREDLPGEQVLDHVNIYETSSSQPDKLLKTYQLYTNNPANIPANNAPDPIFRLRLDSVTMFDANAKRIGAYDMAYNNFSGLPSRTGGQDLWGFYNGLAAGGSQIPYYYTYNSNGTVQNIFGDVNRGVNDTYNQLGVLTQLTYPTGGYSQFQYESNRATVTDSRLVNIVNSSPTTAPTSKSFTWQVDNYPGGTVTQTSGTFTVGNVVPGSSWSFQGHIMSNGTACNEIPNSLNPNYYTFPCFSATLTGTQTDGTKVNQPITFGTSVFVQPGTYQLTITNTLGGDGGIAYATVGWNELPTVTQPGSEIEVGGLRVRSIANYDPVSNATTTKNYQYTYTNSTRSSGTIENIPFFSYTVNMVPVGNAAYIGVLAIGSQSQSPLVTTQGSVIGYANVIETLDNNGTLGQNIYTYTSDDNFLNDPSLYQDGGIAASEQFPFTPTTSNDWKRGLLKQKTVMANVNGTLSTVAATTSTFSFSGTNDINYQMLPNIKFTKEVSTNWISGPPPGVEYDNTYSIYYNSTGSVNNDTNLEQTYDNVNYTGITTKSTSQTLDPQTLESASSSVAYSDKRTITKQYKYALNYTITTATDDATLGIQKLISFNKVTAPVEILEISQDASGNQTVTGGTVLIYYKDKPEVKQVLTLNITAPVPIASFTQSSVNASGNFVYDSRYEARVSADRYTGYMQMAQETKLPGSTKTYLWDYNGQFPVAAITNADSLNVAYTSFEADGTGSWTIGSTTRDATQGLTGNSSYVLSNGVISKTGLTSTKTYVVSYWIKNTSPLSIAGTISGYPKQGATLNGWTYYEHQVTGQTGVTLSGTGNIDELRLYPNDAQMTTYTYDPLMGITSEADTRNSITHYEYDGFQRLMNIKDQYGNIVKHMTYHYQNAPQ